MTGFGVSLRTTAMAGTVAFGLAGPAWAQGPNQPASGVPVLPNGSSAGSEEQTQQNALCGTRFR
jgi:hypothetical protein